MRGHIDDVRRTLDSAEEVSSVGEISTAEPPNNDAWLPDPPGYSDTPHTPDEDPPLEVEGALFSLNDTGNGQRFALYCGDDAIFVPRVGWHIWDGRRWKLDPDGIAVRRLAQTIQIKVIAEIPHLRLEDWQLDVINSEIDVKSRRKELLDHYKEGELELTIEDQVKLDDLDEKIAWIRKLKQRRSSMKSDHRSFAKTSGNKGRIDALLVEATTSLNREVEDLDGDPLCVNTESGTLRFSVDDLRSEGAGKVAKFECEPHERRPLMTGRNQPQYITKLMPVEHDPEAKCPKFDKFLKTVQTDPEMRRFLQRWFGVSMTALPIQKFLYMYGMGANGKSLLATLMRRMMGDYATMVKIESLTGKNRKSGSDATPDMMKLIGARAAITNEPEEGERLQEQKVKELTGGDAMLVRALHADFVEFTPYFKLCFTGNHKLEIRGTDDGIWRRPLLCPFDVQIPEADRDEKLGDKLFDEERSGILNWMIDGLVDYLEGGLQEPAQVLEATEEYRKDSDPIGDFLSTACDIEGGTEWMPARELIDACYLYQLENQGSAWQPGSLSRKLKERSGKYRQPNSGNTYTRHKRGVWGYSGIQLTADMKIRLSNADRDSKGMPMLPKEQRDDTDRYPT